MELKELDVTKCFVDDSDGFWDGFWERRNGLGASPNYADPDSASATLRNYHQALWSRELPNGQVMKLEKGKKIGLPYLEWNAVCVRLHYNQPPVYEMPVYCSSGRTTNR